MEINNSLSGCYEVDQHILLFLDDKDYRNIRLTCRYMHCLLSDDIFWRSKVALCYGNNFLNKHITTTWQGWYYFWVKHHYTLTLIKELNLTPQQGFISITSRLENKVFPGTEAFQSIGLVLEKAVLSGDKELISYFMAKYNSFVASLLSYNPNASPTLPFLNYCVVVEYFLKEKDDHTVRKIIDDMDKVLEHFDRDVDEETSLDLLRLYGKYNRNELAESVLIELEDMCEGVAKQQYISGLIEGHHNKEAINMIDRYYDLLTPSLLLDDAVQADNTEIIDYLRFYYEDEDSFNRDFLNAQEKREQQIQSSLDDREIVISPKDENIYTITFSVNTPCLVLHEAVKLNKTKVISSALYHGRYDFILTLDWSSLKLTDRECCDLCYEALQTPYKDLALYFLLQIAHYFPDNYRSVIGIVDEDIDNSDEDIEIIDEYYDGIFEMLVLANELGRIPTDRLSKVDFHALLMQPLL